MSLMCRILWLALIVLNTISVAHSSIDPTLNEYEFHTRRMKLLRREDINFDAFPSCARPYCNATAALSPSRLGCVEPSLTKKCLCENAVTALACVPSGPSSEDNCWYDSEDWLAGQCDNKVPLVPKSSMPECVQDCATNWLRKKGCRTDSRNCFCKLDEKELVSAVGACKKSGCMKHMRPGFEASFWREQVCAQGDVDTYNEEAYKARGKQVRDIRIAVPVVLGVVALFILFIGFAVEDGDGLCVAGLIVGALILLIIPPIFVAI